MSTPQTHAVPLSQGGDARNYLPTPEPAPEPTPEPAHEEPHLVRTPVYKLPVCRCMLPCCTQIVHGTLVCVCTDCALDHILLSDDPPV